MILGTIFYVVRGENRSRRTFFSFHCLMIHSTDPQTRPIVISISAHVVRPSVTKQNKRRVKIMITTGGTVGWPSGSLMTPTLFALIFTDVVIENKAFFLFLILVSQEILERK